MAVVITSGFLPQKVFWRQKTVLESLVYRLYCLFENFRTDFREAKLIQGIPLTPVSIRTPAYVLPKYSKLLIFPCIHFLLPGSGIGTLMIGLIVRLIATYGVVFGNNLSAKEKIFIALSWLPKATVQVS